MTESAKQETAGGALKVLMTASAMTATLGGWAALAWDDRSAVQQTVAYSEQPTEAPIAAQALPTMEAAGIPADGADLILIPTVTPLPVRGVPTQRTVIIRRGGTGGTAVTQSSR